MSKSTLINNFKTPFAKQLIIAIAIVILLIVPSLAQSERSFPPLPSQENPNIQVGEQENTLNVDMEAWSRFRQGWSSGNWQPFLDITSEDCQFWFPQGEFAGLHEGRDGKQVLEEWTKFHADNNNLIESYAEIITVGGKNFVVESTAEGMPGSPAESYRNYEAIVFRIEGDKVTGIREYWNVLAPGE